MPKILSGDELSVTTNNGSKEMKIMDHKLIKTERGEVHYWLKKNPDKEAKAIVFTHGLTANRQLFDKQVPYFTDEYTVITWDVPLHGLSRPYTDFSYRNAAMDLNRILAEEKIDQVILVGMSMGGYPSQEFAHLYPEKVLAFIALGTTPYGLNYYSALDKWFLKRVGPMARLYPDKLLRKSMAKIVSTTKYGHDLMQTMLQPLSKADIIEQMAIGYGGFLKENKDIKFDFPVLIMVGEHDRTGKVKQYCRAWAKQEGYPLEVIEGAAHLLNADNPAKVNAKIKEFIEENI